MITQIFPCEQLIEFYSNNTIDLRPQLYPLCHVVPTKWRTYRDHRLRDVTSSIVLELGSELTGRDGAKTSLMLEN